MKKLRDLYSNRNFLAVFAILAVVFTVAGVTMNCLMAERINHTIIYGVVVVIFFALLLWASAREKRNVMTVVIFALMATILVNCIEYIIFGSFANEKLGAALNDGLVGKFYIGFEYALIVFYFAIAICSFIAILLHGKPTKHYQMNILLVVFLTLICIAQIVLSSILLTPNDLSAIVANGLLYVADICIATCFVGYSIAIARRFQ